MDETPWNDTVPRRRQRCGSRGEDGLTQSGESELNRQRHRLRRGLDRGVVAVHLPTRRHIERRVDLKSRQVTAGHGN